MRYRLDTPSLAFSTYDAVCALFVAVQNCRPDCIRELRDLPRHQLEGWHPVPADRVNGFDQRARQEGLGYVQPISHVLPQGQPQIDAANPSFRNAVFIDEELHAGHEPQIVVMVPTSITDWATKWHISCAAVEVAAVLVRCQWVLNAEFAARCELAFSSLPMMLGSKYVRVLGEVHWSALDHPEIGAQPMLESEEEFLGRAKVHYRKRREALVKSDSLMSEDGAAFVEAPAWRELQRHAAWLAHVQVALRSPASLAQEFRVSRDAVAKAVRRLARQIGMQLRKLPITGRPPGAADRRKRRRISPDK